MNAILILVTMGLVIKDLQEHIHVSVHQALLEPTVLLTSMNAILILVTMGLVIKDLQEHIHVSVHQASLEPTVLLTSMNVIPILVKMEAVVLISSLVFVAIVDLVLLGLHVLRVSKGNQSIINSC